MSRAVSQSFRDRADGAAFFEAWVGMTLTRAGLWVILHPWTMDGDDYGQSWDLDVMVAPTSSFKNERGAEVSTFAPLNHNMFDVKSLSVSYGGVSDYPFNDVLVCSQSSYNRKFGHLKSSGLGGNFLLVSKVTGSIVWVPKGSPITMNNTVHDRGRNEVYQAVRTSKQYLRPLQDMVELLKKQESEQWHEEVISR